MSVPKRVVLPDMFRFVSACQFHRQAYTVRRLREAGYTVTADPALQRDAYDAVLLPLPVTSDGTHIQNTNIRVRPFCESLAPGTVLFAGQYWGK